MSRCTHDHAAARRPPLMWIGGLLLPLTLLGCGQTGPLYLPDDSGSVIIRQGAGSATTTQPSATMPATPTPAPTPAPAPAPTQTSAETPPR